MDQSAKPDTLGEDFEPRDYQREMKKVCMQKNTLIYLPTGAGKTHIALMVIKAMAGDLTKPLSQGGKRTFFVVNTVALAKQQAQFLSRNVPYETTIYTSDRNVDTWKADLWLEEFAKYQVVVCTCQILLDVLKHGYLSVRHINLLIFDECHHGVGDHPMHGIMEQFLRTPKVDHPRVIGLSGMLLYRQLKLVEQVSPELEKLENTFLSTIATVGSYDAYTEVCKFSTNPTERLIRYSDSVSTPVIAELIKGINDFIVTVENFHLPKFLNQNKSLQRDMPKPKKQIVKYFKEVIYQIQDLGLFGGSIAVLGLIVQFELDKRQSDSSMLRLLCRACITYCETLRHRMERLMEGMPMKQKLTRFSSIKARQLINYLEESYHTSYDKTAKALIFVQRRFSAKVLYHLLKIYFSETEDADFIVPDFMVGNNGNMPESIEQILRAKKDRKVLDRFKKNEINVIVATNVLEEGIDLQMCNMVVKYDHPQTFASYEQSKGRARMEDSQYVVFVNDADRDKFLKNYVLYKSFEEELRKCLIGKTINRPDPLDEDVRKELMNEIIPPFFTPKGAKLDALSSIQLLNRYCMGMPRDAFTNTNVSWERTDLPNGKIVVSVLLPLQSTVREKIASAPMTNVKLAKRSAAFNACKKLYEQGELSDYLIPIDSKRQLESLSNVYFEHWNKFADDRAKVAGTAKCLRSHSIKNPPQTTNCCPQPGKPCFLYIIRIKAGFEQDPSNENIKIFHQLYSSENNFGIMTTKALPMLAGIKLFVTLGLIDVQIVPEPIVLPNAGSVAELEELKKFHVMVFRDMLKLWKQFLVVDNSNDANSFLIVPLKHSQEIDWPIVKQFPYLEEPTELAPRARERMRFDPDRYHHRVILPWYKNNMEQFYVVTMVHEHLTPESPFPNPQYRSYEEYFSTVYHQHVVNKQQFLIEVKGITTYLNRLSPGSEQEGRSTRSKHWTFNEILIPELCYNFEFPADYWLKATMLPSVLHRIHYLLHAENLRVDLATAVGIGCLENRIVDSLDVIYKERPAEAMELDELIFESDDDEDDEFDYEEAKKELSKPQDLSQVLREQLNNFTDDLVLPWAEKDEPEDIDRKWDEITKIDIDYYDTFVRKFSDLNLRENVAKNMSSSYTTAIHRRTTSGSPSHLPAIGDVPLDEKFKIKMLSLTPQNTAQVTVQQKDIIKAITTKPSADVYDLERNELLGDAFLKFAISVYLVKHHKDWHEGYLTAVKGKLVSNRNLVYCAMQLGTPGMMKIHKFDPKNDWQPPLATVPQKIKLAMVEGNQSARILYKLQLSEEEVKSGSVDSDKLEDFMTLLDADNKNVDPSPMQNYLSQQVMNDKVAADAMEALLGVCVSSVGVKRSFKMLSYLGILPKAQNLISLLDDKIQNQRLKTDISQSELDAFLVNPSRIEGILNYRFQDRAYLLQALTHASFPTNRLTGSYQQLEFLGDAVLDILISAYIYEHNPTMSPGQLTDLRSALVNNVTLACLLVRNGLHLYILSESASFSDTVNKFVAFQELQKHEITDQVSLLVEETSDKIGEFVDVPKALGDVFESLVGAIFLDSGNDLEITWKVIYGLMHNEILNFTKDTPIQIVRQLYEFKPNCLPKFCQAVIDDDTVMVKLQYRIRNQAKVAYGFGQNKDDAKRAAAKVALKELRQQ
ncbi:endoribonuclease Dicer-like [Sabethes cyaneus]|uniref:endoribonuclease Dicer-like n=1 Tax=Sabethes cyaneus TaxID=53552 RepID=UPI00237D797C|nr:endoribonuclease Dicer-like [Sabethes cyaneus]